jgi:hypothetical protein
MRIGILGSGLMGGKLGTIFARAGHEVVFSYARSKQKLAKLARNAKGNAIPGTPREAALAADAVLLAVHWSRVGDVLKQAGDLSGKVIVSCSLPMNAKDTELVVGHTSSGAETLARKWSPSPWRWHRSRTRGTEDLRLRTASSVAGSSATTCQTALFGRERGVKLCRLRRGVSRLRRSFRSHSWRFQCLL